MNVQAQHIMEAAQAVDTTRFASSIQGHNAKVAAEKAVMRDAAAQIVEIAGVTGKRKAYAILDALAIVEPDLADVVASLREIDFCRTHDADQIDLIDEAAKSIAELECHFEGAA